MARNRPIITENSQENDVKSTAESKPKSSLKPKKSSKKKVDKVKKSKPKKVKEKPVKKDKSNKKSKPKKVKEKPKKSLKKPKDSSESKLKNVVGIAKQGYSKTPRVIGWLKRTGTNILGVVDDVLKGSHHHILTKQLLMAGGAIFLALFSWNLSNGAYHKNLRIASYDETVFSNHNSLEFTSSGTSVESSKLYKSEDGKTVYLPLIFSNSSTAQMPLDASQMKTKISYAGSVLESSKLSGEMVGIPSLDNSMFYVYVIHKPDNKYTNVSSTFNTTVTANLTQQSETDDSGKLKKVEPDVLSFTVDLGSSKASKMSSNDDKDNIRKIYSDFVFKKQVNDIIDDANTTLKSNQTLYNQSTALIDTLDKSGVKIPAVPQFASKDESGNVYSIDYSSNIRKGFFPKSSYETLKRQYLGQGYTDMSNRFNVGMNVDLLTNPEYQDGKTVPQSDSSSLNAASSLSTAWSSIISNKSKAYVDDAQSLFTLQYQYDFNVNKTSVADNDYFEFAAK